MRGRDEVRGGRQEGVAKALSLNHLLHQVFEADMGHKDRLGNSGRHQFVREL